MSLQNLSAGSRKSLLTSAVAMAIGAGAVAWLSSNSPIAPQAAMAQTSKSKAVDKDKHDAAEHAADTAALKLAFSGASVDLFFEPGELEGNKAGLTGLKFLDHVDVTGKELLRFVKAAGETYLIDPDTVFVYRARKGK